MEVEWTYWVYAVIQSMLMLTCVVSCTLFAFWSVETHYRPRPELWAILPLSVWTHAAIAVIAMRWLIPRVTDMPFTVKMLRAVGESQSYTSYALTSGALLLAVSFKLAKVWKVRRWSSAALALVFTGLLIVSTAAAYFHHDRIVAFCAQDYFRCSLD